MKTIMRLATAALVVGAAGCGVDNESSIEILGSPAWEVETETVNDQLVVTSCIAPASADVYRSMDTFDVANGFSFTRPFIVRNNLASNADEGASRLNTHNYVTEKAIIEYDATDEATASIVQAFSTEVPVGLNVSADGGEHGVALTIIPRNIGQLIADSVLGASGPDDVRTILVDVRLSGRLLDGQEMESQGFTFPVNVCNGCMSPCETAECVCSHYVR